MLWVKGWKKIMKAKVENVDEDGFSLSSQQILLNPKEGSCDFYLS